MWVVVEVGSFVLMVVDDVWEAVWRVMRLMVGKRGGGLV